MEIPVPSLILQDQDRNGIIYKNHIDRKENDHLNCSIIVNIKLEVILVGMCSSVRQGNSMDWTL